ncbi:MAG: FIST N-terminal domain-containing protein [Phycisphaeraceae bacterium JB051]
MPQSAASMAFYSAVSDFEDPTRAIDHVLGRLESRVDRPFDLVVMYVTSEMVKHFQAMAKRLKQALKPRVMIGSAGVAVAGVQTDIQGKAGVSVLAATLPGVQIKPMRFHPGEWGQVLNDTEFLTQQIITDPLNDPKAMILLADPFSTPMISFLPTLKLVAPQMKIIGGMASSGDSPGNNRFVLNDQYWFDGAVGITLTGDLDVSCTLSQGARPIGQPMIVTKADKHVIHELRGKPAIKVLNELIETLGPLERNLVKSNGVLVGRVINEYKSHFGRGDFLVRNVVGYDDESGVIAINDSRLRVGQTVQFHVQDRDTAVEDFSMLLEVERLKGGGRGTMIFPSNTRSENFFGIKHTDAHQVYDALGDIPLAGFATAGEIGPVGDQNFMHSHTVSMVTFRPIQSQA